MTRAPRQDVHYTIHDIARMAEVSAKTVSRVINEAPGVGEDTRARILRLIEDVGYYPHTGARSMRSRPRDCLGVTVSAPMAEVPINEDLFLFLFHEIYRIFGAQGNYVVFDLNPYATAAHVDYARGLWEQRYAGCVVIGPLKLGDKTVARIHASGHPYLVLSRLDSLPEISHATVDYEEGAYLSTRLLIERGHRRIGMLKAFSGFHPGLERRRGYLRALEEAGLEPCGELIRSVNFGTREITNAVHGLLQDTTMTALVDCSAAEDATSLREGARRAGRMPGEDFEIVAWTYTDKGAVLSEACAHVWLPVVEAACEGFTQLAAWFRGERNDPVSVLYRPTLYRHVTEGEVSKPRHLFDLST